MRNCKMTADENYVPPPLLNDNAFFTGLSLSVLGLLRRLLYDFKERVLRSPIPTDRMGFHAKATSEMWQPSKATKLFEHILAFLKERLETGVCLLEASENGKQVIECLRNWSRTGARSSAT